MRAINSWMKQLHEEGERALWASCDEEKLSVPFCNGPAAPAAALDNTYGRKHVHVHSTNVGEGVE